MTDLQRKLQKNQVQLVDKYDVFFTKNTPVQFWIFTSQYMQLKMLFKICLLNKYILKFYISVE